MFSFKEKSIQGIIFLLVVLICVIPIGCYFSVFNEKSLSTSDWSNFATFFSAFISLANLAVFIYFSNLVFEYNKKKDKQIEELDKPILVFIKNRKDSYKISNIGRGPALNVSVKVIKDEPTSSLGYMCYSINVNQEIELPKSDNTLILVANYTDIMGNDFFSSMKNDVMICVIQRGDKNQELRHKDAIKEAQEEVNYTPIN